MPVAGDDALGLLVLEALVVDESSLLLIVVSKRCYVSGKYHEFDPLLSFGSVLEYSFVVLVEFPSLIKLATVGNYFDLHDAPLVHEEHATLHLVHLNAFLPRLGLDDSIALIISKMAYLPALVPWRDLSISLETLSHSEAMILFCLT